MEIGGEIAAMTLGLVFLSPDKANTDSFILFQNIFYIIKVITVQLGFFTQLGFLRVSRTKKPFKISGLLNLCS